ncbi:MAG: hypothetical protein WBD07_08845 [Vicinamibacterales bacterium]
MTRRILLACALVLGLGQALGFAPSAQSTSTSTLPVRLSDQEFWRLVTDSSEANGFFRSDNLTSNELLFQHVVPDLIRRTRPGGVYLGVGPEQNFTYMAAVRPAIAIIFDIRRGNLHAQLMYKALFELARDRAEFVSLLFSKPRPARLGPTSSVTEIFAAFAESPTSDGLRAQTFRAIQDHLTKIHKFPLAPEDLEGIDYVFGAFHARGFAIRPTPTYAELMTATDEGGVGRGYLATEAAFTFLKNLESRNLVIPVVGDFGGPKAIRAVGAYLKAHAATVSAFYLSNVEQYLYQDSKWTAFCRNVQTLPLDATSTFIRSSNNRGSGVGFGRGPGFVSSLGAMAAEVKDCGS